MRIFFDFYKLETENSLLHVFNFLHKLSFESNFCFVHFRLPNKFFSLKNKKIVFENRKKEEKTVTKHTLIFFMMTPNTKMCSHWLMMELHKICV